MTEELQTGVNETAAESTVTETQETQETAEQTGEETTTAAESTTQDEMGSKIKEIRESMKADYEKKYGEFKGKAEKLETTLEKTARANGFVTPDGKGDVEALQAALEEHERAAEKQRYEQAGITDPKIIDELIEKNPVVQQAKKLTEERKFNEEASELSVEFKEVFGRDITAEDVSDDVIKHRDETGKTLTEAFFYVNRKNFKTLMDEAKTKAQKKTLADVHDRARRGIVNPESEGEDVDITDIDTEMASAFGNDPKEIAKYKKSKLRS